jgi:hypothetical protein
MSAVNELGVLKPDRVFVTATQAGGLFTEVIAHGHAGIITLPGMFGDDTTNFVALFQLTNRYITANSVVLLTPLFVGYLDAVLTASIVAVENGYASVMVSVLRGGFGDATTAKLHFHVITS